MTIDELVGRCQNAKATGESSWQVRCPAHDDQQASLSLKSGNEGRILMHCHAGCKNPDILKAWGLKWQDVMGQRDSRKREIEQTYDYNDEDGNLLFQVVRMRPKAFLQRRPDPNRPGEWLWKTTDVKRVLYRLREVLEAKAANQWILLVEGEKDVHSALDLGFCATTNSGGAGKWLRSYTETLAGAKVVLIPDNDAPGLQHMRTVARELLKVATDVRMIKLPGAKDLTDWIMSGGTAEKLAGLIEEVLSFSDTGDAMFYDRDKKEYVTKNMRGVWYGQNEGQTRQFLALSGFSGSTSKEQPVSEIVQKMHEIRHGHDVDYVGRLAGWDAGVYELGARRILVTQSPDRLLPAPGKWPVLRKLVEGMFAAQVVYFHGWMRIGMESFSLKTFRPGPAFVMAGPRESGKSLLQRMITVMYGGRSAKPYDFMIGRTPFNGDLFDGEHLVIEDAVASTTWPARRAFGAELKQITACDEQRCHAKHRQPVMLNPFWRLTISLNDEPENLMVLPPIDESIADKIILVRVHKEPMPMPANTPTEQAAFWATLTGELPHYLHWLLNTFTIPQQITGPRYGLRVFQDETLSDTLHDLSPEAQLWEMIEAELFPQSLSHREWHGTSQDLEKQLKNEGGSTREARELMSWSNACGSLLARLRKRVPDRVLYNRTNSKREWTILPPGLPGEGQVPELTQADLLPEVPT